MLTAIVVPADPEQPARLEQLGKNNLDAYRRLVGGNIEVVSLERPPASLYFNEEGKFTGLSLNLRATALLWAHNSAFRGRDNILGDAFILGPPDRQGDDTSAPEELVALLFHTGSFRVLIKNQGDERYFGHLPTYDSWFTAYVRGVELAQRWSQIEEIQVVAERGEERNMLIEEWFRIGLENPWIAAAYDPPFTRESFHECHTLIELEERIGHGNWAVGTTFFYRDLCFINQVEGGDEWLTIRHGIAFESITFGPIIERGRFVSLVRRLLAATKQQCQELTY